MEKLQPAPRTYDVPIDDDLNTWCKLFTVSEWEKQMPMKPGEWCYWVKDGLRSSESAIIFDPQDATHVAWYQYKG